MRLYCFICVLFVFVGKFCLAQEVKLQNSENNAKSFAISSAHYSKVAYKYSRTNYFSDNINLIKQNCDSGLIAAHIAIDHADSAVFFAHDSCVLAKELMNDVINYQKNAIQAFKQLKNNLEKGSFSSIMSDSKVSMLDMGNAITDAYMASFYLETDIMTIDVKRDRDVIRLESDESSYITLKELYIERMIEIKGEISLLKEEAKKSSGEELLEINKAIDQLVIEEKQSSEKIKNCDNKLINVKNELSKEMLKIVNKDIFTTERIGFYNENVPVPLNSDVPKGLVYRIQIGFFVNQLPPEHFEGVFPISSEKVDETYFKYEAGNFSNYEDAKEARLKVMKKGYTDSFIVAYYDGKKITINEALKRE